ncbi:hypothetical protein Palpr_0447 [Paludibacter propionicigenes WB4]|uniref:DUF4249 domain-containing protein n=1 Tax=Paludibacter propionicigenes (strain DSM 17365 / JCM 13257 / WB4) TaxID=694427 RepID=E4T1L3_PALPW|nr:DUF4249 domain-containing protein [Paludibacter propionicigenes]ADQ78607.1 hypothetical protein Palpr_0447 [Paludibacter propionicigenes WB4]
MRIKFNIVAIIVATILTACTTDIALDLKNATPELVVEGAVTSDTLAHVIQLKKTAAYFSNQSAEMISGATVTLDDGVSKITLIEDAINKGNYQTPVTYHGVAGRTYTLTIDNIDVNADGIKEQYTATTKMNAVSRIDSIMVKKERIFQSDMWAVKASIQDPENERNYYRVRSYKNNKLTTDSIQEWGVTDDEFFNGKYLINERMIYLSGSKKDEKLKSGDLIMLEMSGITKEYKEFIEQAQSEFWGRNPMFGGQPANIITNIKQTLPLNGKNNPHGYFAAYSISRATTVYDGN